MDPYATAIPVTAGVVAVVVIGSAVQLVTGRWERVSALGVAGTTVAAGSYVLSRLATTPALDRSYELPLVVVGFASSAVVVALGVWYAVQLRQG